MESWTHHFVTVNKVKLHYVKQGDGPLVILLHGFPEFWYSWRHQIPVLAEKYTVVALDLRGFNLSAKPEGSKHYKYSLVARDIREIITKLGFRKATVIGHDWGGAITWHFAREFPGVLDRMVILNCPPPQILLWSFKNNWGQLKKSWYMFFFQLPRIPEWYMSRDLKKTFTKTFRGWTHNKNAFTDEDIDQYVQAYSAPGAFTPPINYYRAAFKMSFDERYRLMRSLFTPALIIWGEEDRALNKELSANLGKYCREYYDIKYIADAGHFVQNDAPELVNQYIMEFLAKSDDQLALEAKKYIVEEDN